MRCAPVFLLASSLLLACAESTPDGMVRVPAGTLPAEEGLPAVTLDPYFLDRLPVTNSQWAAAGAPNRTRRPLGRDPAFPATAVTYADAEAFCASRGGRLPTDAELLLAATAGDGRAYPWGASWEDARVAPLALGPHVPGRHPTGASPSGVEDLVGNVFQWTRTLVEVTGLQPSPELRGTLRVVRGGCCAALPAWNTAAYRTAVPEERDPYFLGFRCTRPTGDGDPNLARDRPVPWARLDLAEVTRQALADLYGPLRDPTPPAVATLLASIPAGSVVADIGCGLGALTITMARQIGPTGKAYAVDADATVLPFVEAAARAEGLANVVPVRAIPDDTQLQPGTVDFVLLFQMANSVGDADLPGFAASALRAVRPGGRLVVYEPPPFPPTRFLAEMEDSGLVLEPPSGPAASEPASRRALWVFRAPESR